MIAITGALCSPVSIFKGSSLTNESENILYEKTKCKIYQENGQQFFGPPENWKKPVPNNSEIYFSRLPMNSSVDEIYNYFSQVGFIYKMRLMIAFDGSYRGFGFVVYATEKEAIKACQILPKIPFRRGIHLNVTESLNITTLQIIDIPNKAKEDEVKQDILNQITGVTNMKVFKNACDKWKMVLHFNTHKEAAIARRTVKICSPKWGPDIKVVLPSNTNGIKVGKIQEKWKHLSRTESSGYQSKVQMGNTNYKKQPISMGTSFEHRNIENAKARSFGNPMDTNLSHINRKSLDNSEYNRKSFNYPKTQTITTSDDMMVQPFTQKWNTEPMHKGWGPFDSNIVTNDKFLTKELKDTRFSDTQLNYKWNNADLGKENSKWKQGFEGQGSWQNFSSDLKTPNNEIGNREDLRKANSGWKMGFDGIQIWDNLSSVLKTSNNEIGNREDLSKANSGWKMGFDGIKMWDNLSSDLKTWYNEIGNREDFRKANSEWEMGYDGRKFWENGSDLNTPGRDIWKYSKKSVNDHWGMKKNNFEGTTMGNLTLNEDKKLYSENFFDYSFLDNAPDIPSLLSCKK